jgi:phosphoglycerol transferase MdoB-like AlkP superfamily enzyme
MAKILRINWTKIIQGISDITKTFVVGLPAKIWPVLIATCVILGLIRLGQIFWLTPSQLHVSDPNLIKAIFQGFRFDLKVGAIVSLFFILNSIFTPRSLARVFCISIITLIIFISIVNIQFFDFYKEPINVNVFGLIEDDTEAILKTIWRDFPVFFPTFLTLTLAFSFLKIQRFLEEITLKISLKLEKKILIIFVIFSVASLTFATKGTARAMALGQQHVSVTSSQFLNNMIPNGATSLFFAWQNWREAHRLSDLTAGLRRMGFMSHHEALATLNLVGSPIPNVNLTPEDLDISTKKVPKRKNLIFFLMESWGAEPMLYHSKQFDVLGRFEGQLRQGCHFSNFDSSTNSTFAAVESLLFSSPISPLTIGRHGTSEISWGVPSILRKHGYRTIFLTSARSGWRQMDRIMLHQGFDKIIDSGALSNRYSDAEPGIWGVWDEYAFAWLREFLEKDDDERPLFVFVLTSTNHSPYELPKSFRAPLRDNSKWLGEKRDGQLAPSLDTYYYSSDQLGRFLDWYRNLAHSKNSIVAATGDHNGRTFGNYTSAERRHLLNQVPFVIWGAPNNCGTQLELPSSHRDVFPTIFPALNIRQPLPGFGRNLFETNLGGSTSQIPKSNPISLNYMGYVRNSRGSWRLGEPDSFVCTPNTSIDMGKCVLDSKDASMERASLGLIDWLIRSNLTKPSSTAH